MEGKQLCKILTKLIPSPPKSYLKNSSFIPGYFVNRITKKNNMVYAKRGNPTHDWSTNKVGAVVLSTNTNFNNSNIHIFFDEHIKRQDSEEGKVAWHLSTLDVIL